MQHHLPKGINISNRLRAHYVFPSAGYVPFPDTKGYAEYEHAPNNPGLPNSSSWSVEHSYFGTSYDAVPTCLGLLQPNRVQVVLPDQMDWPASMWSRLDARDSVHTPGPRIASLGIAAYLAQGLGHWSDNLEDFARVYKELPFGSSIRLKEVTEDPKDAEFIIQPNEALEKPGVFLSVSDLRSMWGLEESGMPPTVSYTGLHRLKQCASDAILVSFRNDQHTDAAHTLMMFKSSRNKPSRIYHEIKMLLRTEPLETIIGPPKYLVTLPNSQTVCGFLATYYVGGDLSNILTERRLAGTLTLDQQLCWARDLTASLVHVQHTPMKFYSDLRLDQLVLSPPKPNGQETAILLDFEQGRNLYNWAPPEIYYLEWIAELGNDDYARFAHLPAETKEKYGEILDRYLQSRGFPQPLMSVPQCYDNPENGWYWPWLASNDMERESGMVYMLGRALWCIFEGIGDADIVLGRSTQNDGQPRFPTFNRTPPVLRELIKRCTAGARQWLDGPMKVYRRKGKVFLLGRTGLDGEAESTFEETKEGVAAFWREEMRKAEEFVEARMRFDRGEQSAEDVELLHYLRRPTLEEVFWALIYFEA